MILVLVVMTSPAAAVTYKVGVSPGVSSIYASKFSYAAANKTVIAIFAVVGTVVYTNITYYNPDNSVNSERNNPGIDANANSFAGMTYLIASNLTTNDPTWPGSPYIINDSSTMTFAGASRTVNHMKMSKFNSTSNYIEAWWDKDTGLMVKLALWIPGSWDNFTMISTTAWSPSPPAQSAFTSTSIIAAAGVGIVALIIGFLVGRSGRRKR
jgi:hypothetical protein